MKVQVIFLCSPPQQQEYIFGSAVVRGLYQHQQEEIDRAKGDIFANLDWMEWNGAGEWSLFWFAFAFFAARRAGGEPSPHPPLSAPSVCDVNP
jgi:hypothetical protein